MFEEKFFAHKKMNAAKLLSYGFVQGSDSYQYTADVMNGQLQLFVFVRPDGVVTTRMLDNATGEDYVLYQVASSTGAYVGEVRAACERILTEISQLCFEPDVFHGAQTTALIDHVREAYGDELEFLWDKFSDNAVWRRKDNQKWYGLLVRISGRKLGLASDEIVEAIDLRLDPARMQETIDNARYFPGWHMNKKSWYTMVLDGSIPMEELCLRIEESYRLAAKR